MLCVVLDKIFDPKIMKTLLIDSNLSLTIQNLILTH